METTTNLKERRDDRDDPQKKIKNYVRNLNPNPTHKLSPNSNLSVTITVTNPVTNKTASIIDITSTSPSPLKHHLLPSKNPLNQTSPHSNQTSPSLEQTSAPPSSSYCYSLLSFPSQAVLSVSFRIKTFPKKTLGFIKKTVTKPSPPQQGLQGLLLCSVESGETTTDF